MSPPRSSFAGSCLCAKRSGKKANPHKWEFPGGKVERGETPEAALVREIKEELNTEIRIIGHYRTIVHPYDAYTIQLSTYWVRNHQWHNRTDRPCRSAVSRAVRI
ncbi:MAG: NUDIX domain-containing protein [Bacillus subtilis]|nr:NUDIX domain-containing protein [Bacillus subtilis]